MTQFKYHTVSKKIPGDLLTPVTAYLNVRDIYSQSVLMESSDYHIITFKYIIFLKD